ncbi:MAG TPA: G1 family glutamic endopeptidase, partial [Ktedonobacteraceae bacterium]
MKTLPGAVCTLHEENESDPAHSLKLFADQKGIIHFHVSSSVEYVSLAKVVIDCDVNGNITRFPLELRVSFQPTFDMPVTIEMPRAESGSVTVLPALTEDDMLQLSRKELLRRGYPPSPNPEKQKQWAVDSWLRAFSIPLTFVEPKTIAYTHLSQGPGAIAHEFGLKQVVSDNWSGFMLIRGGPYCVVTGRWTVPSVYSAENRIDGEAQASIWVGLDGWDDFGLPALPQAGTLQTSLDIHELTFCGYHAWSEFWPDQLTMQVLPELKVSPGDEMLVSIWMGDKNSDLKLNGDFVFWLANLTNHEYTSDSIPRGTTTVVHGTTAEWIVERPILEPVSATGPRNYANLSDYNSLNMVGYAAHATG